VDISVPVIVFTGTSLGAWINHANRVNPEIL
jgi:hypothetical protein